MAYVDHLRLSGLKGELVKDRYVVLYTVTMTTQKHKTKQKQNTKATKSTHKQNTRNNNQTKFRGGRGDAGPVTCTCASSGVQEVVVWTAFTSACHSEGSIFGPEKVKKN